MGLHHVWDPYELLHYGLIVFALHDRFKLVFDPQCPSSHFVEGGANRCYVTWSGIGYQMFYVLKDLVDNAKPQLEVI